MKNYSIRKNFNDIHLWLGIVSGIILFIICLTGTILTFQEEIVEFIDSELYEVEIKGESIKLEKIIEIVENENHVSVKEIIKYPEANRALTFSVIDSNYIKNPPEKRIRPDYISVDQYSANSMGKLADGSGSKIVHYIEEIHRFLLMGPNIGRAVTGAATIIFVILCFSGLWLWFPKKLKHWQKLKFWKQGFTIKISNWKRINYDIHNTFGFYLLFPLLIMGFSAFIWSYEWYYEGLEKVLGDKLGKARFDKTVMIDSSKTISSKLNIDELLKISDKELNYDALAYRITLPESDDKSIMIRKKPAGFFRYDAADKIQLNPYTGEIIDIERFKDYSFGSKVAQLIRSIHVGSFYGSFTKWIYFFACLVATTLPITGTIIWINKLRSKIKNKIK